MPCAISVLVASGIMLRQTAWSNFVTSLLRGCPTFVDPQNFQIPAKLISMIQRCTPKVWKDVRALFGPSVVFVLGGPGAGKGCQCSRSSVRMKSIPKVSAARMARTRLLMLQLATFTSQNVTYQYHVLHTSHVAFWQPRIQVINTRSHLLAR